MRVVLVLGPSTGGIGRHVAVTTLGPAETLQRFPMVAPAAGLTVRSVRTAARGADVVHAHGVRAGLVAAAALVLPTSDFRRVPLVVTWHNLVGTGGRLGTLVQRVVARRAAVSLCVSPDLVAHVRRLGGRAQLAPVGGTRRERSGRSVEAIRSELGVGPGQRLVVAVARLNRQKGLDVLQTAAERLATDVHVVVAGDGPERNRLGAPLHLLGARDDVADLLAVADVVVLPSRWEGSPLAAHEALLAGRPLVATAVGGVPALIGEAEPAPAVLVPAEDPGALAGALTRLLDDPTERAALAERALVRAAEWPDAARTVAAVRETYRVLLAGDDR